MSASRPPSADLPFDWVGFSRVALERQPHPAAVLDARGVIRLANSAVEKAIGHDPSALEGAPWQVLVVSDDLPTAHDRVREALARGFRQHEVHLKTRSGDHVVASVDMIRFGEPASPGLLVLATRIQPALRGGQSLGARDAVYEVTASGPDFGRLHRLLPAGGTHPIVDPGRRCFELLHGRQQPCSDCPLPAEGVEPTPRTRVRVLHVDEGSGRRERSYQLLTTEPIDGVSARVRVRVIPEDALGAIRDLQVSTLVREAGLTVREEEVLRYLLMGRSIRDIAEILGISARTVKFHQYNLLEKVGADSRTDLVRLLP